MSKIWDDIQLEYDGEIYTVTPTIDFLNFIENEKGMSLTNLSVRMSEKDPPSGLMLNLIAKTIRWAGGEASTADIFEATGGISQDLVIISNMIMKALYGKNMLSGGQPSKKLKLVIGEEQPPNSRKRTGKKRTGRNSTG